MNTRIKNNKPLYQFNGFNIESVKFQRSSVPDNDFEYFGIKCLKLRYDEAERKYFTDFEINIKYSKDADSQILFKTIFTINDMDWLHSFKNPDETLPAMFFSIVFPYLREKIYSLTDDSRGTLQMPIIDLRGTSLSSGIKLYPIIEKHSRTTKNNS